MATNKFIENALIADYFRLRKELAELDEKLEKIDETLKKISKKEM